MNTLPISIVTSDDYFPPDEAVCLDCIEDTLPGMLRAFGAMNDDGLIETILPSSITRKLISESPGNSDADIRAAFHRAVEVTMSLELNDIAKTFAGEGGVYQTVFELVNVDDVERTGGTDEFASWAVAACWLYLSHQDGSVFPELVATSWQGVDGTHTRYVDGGDDDDDEK